MRSDVSDLLKVGDFVTITEGLYAGIDGEVLEVVNTITPWVGRARLRLPGYGDDYWHPFWSDPMDEAEWLTTRNTASMERWVETRRSIFSARKWRLLCCAYVRRIWQQLDARSQRSLVLSEQFADGTASWEEVRRLADELPAFQFTQDDLINLRSPVPEPGACATRFCCLLNVDLTSLRLLVNGADDQWWFAASGKASGEIHRAFLRDIFDNPFRPVLIDSDLLAWNHATIPALARHIYDSHRFDEMPVLGDALEDAGCTDEHILSHCRTPIHARGCWLLDAILGLA